MIPTVPMQLYPFQSEFSAAQFGSVTSQRNLSLHCSVTSVWWVCLPVPWSFAAWTDFVKLSATIEWLLLGTMPSANGRANVVWIPVSYVPF